MTWDTTKNTDFKTWSGQPEPVARRPAPAPKAEVIARLADLLARDVLSVEQFIRVIEALKGEK